MENVSDRTRAIIYALLVHVIGFALLFFGLMWTQTAQPISIPGAVIEAELVGPASAPKPRAAPRPKPAAPKPEPPAPKPPEPKPEPPAQPQRNDAVEREKIVDVADLKAEKAERAQEERHHQEQIRLEDEQQKREAAESERMKQLDDIRKQREAAEKKRKIEQEKLAQLNDLQKQQVKPKTAPADLPDSDQARTGMAGQDTSLAAEYYAAIQNAVTQNWLRPDNAPPGLRCMLRIVQIPGGDVLSVDIINPCNADAQTRTSIEQAVKRAAPLPYKGYEKVFSRSINFNFQFEG
jgi:colicin import membrane protein